MMPTPPMTRISVVDPQGGNNHRRSAKSNGWRFAIQTFSIKLLFITCCAAFVIGCGPSKGLLAEDQTSTNPIESASSGPVTGTASRCHSLPMIPVISSAKWTEPDRRLLVVGTKVGEGESDRRFEVMDAKLLLTSIKKACLLATVPLGKVTRFVSEGEKLHHTEVLELEIHPLGEMDGFHDAVAFERASLPGGHIVLLVHLMRDVRFGLTERYVVPVTIQGSRLIAGDRVQTGRDAMKAPVYYGTFKVGSDDQSMTPRLVLNRKGMGNFPKRVIFSLDAQGALRAVEQSMKAPGPPIAKEKRNGRDVAHALQVCGPEGAAQRLGPGICPEGLDSRFERKGIAGTAQDGHIVDRYEVYCGSSEKLKKTIFVDIYHCEDRSYIKD